MGNCPEINLLIIDENREKFSKLKKVYSKAFEDILNEKKYLFNYVISNANSYENASKKIIKNIQHERIQILHVTDSESQKPIYEFVYDERRKHPDQNLRAILSSESNKDYRKYGIIATVSGYKDLFPALKKAVEYSFLIRKPAKQQIQDAFIFKPIDTVRGMKQYYQQRFHMWNKLGYIPPEYISESNLEMDEYDKYSIPLGGFDKMENLCIIVRIITHQLQQRSIEITKRILNETNDRKLAEIYFREPLFPYSVYRDIGEYDSINSIIQKSGGLSKTVEYSRIMVTNPDYRGKRLSTKMIQFIFLYSKYVLNKKLGLAVCLVSHAKHHCEKNGFSGTLDGIGNIDAQRVEQVASVIYVDLDNISDEEPSFHNTNIKNQYDFFLRNRHFCYCHIDDCAKDNYKNWGTKICPIRQKV